ncbi:hypothetical protein N7539_003099 [Penicillium diatomitis]|uniref:Uncharacterized protein n=1 Tax=Penicillium diatomitis TaxID=2819901 RepID=A0A9X0BZU0_9EURO|nr:uncharacterized protein N7539_003099 [Penicillium diatomitis]KAJ5491532.1 hypothetical protein N7539_003099 [Penicillium diatomitis]
MSETVRLHISPFTPEILPVVLPPSLRETATEISFHSIPTFPENAYGYVTLPKMDAEKIKKKLNGSILKGRKFKVETARPSKRDREDGEDTTKKERKSSKKRKSEEQEDGVLEGYELPSDRKVKRGWTEPSKKDRRRAEKSKNKGEKTAKPQPKSKYTEKEECLFRTKIPSNRKSLEAADEKKAKKVKKGMENVVHEFAKATTFPSFLRTANEGTAPTAEFEDEKGWVDASGKVKEVVSEKRRKSDHHPGQVPGAKVKKSEMKKLLVKKKSPELSSESEDYTSSSGSSSDESSDSESEVDESTDESSTHEEANDASDSPKKTVESAPGSDHAADSSSASSSSDSDSDSDPDSNADSDSDSESDTEMVDQPTQDTLSRVAESQESKPRETETQPTQEVHPLEALFKKQPSTASNKAEEPGPATGFSFFGGDDVESEEETQPAEPQTPFTPFAKKDLQFRGLRSAAPTPDTAAVNRRMNWTGSEGFDEEDVEPVIDTPVSKTREQEEPKEETEFAKWFWENRGDNNRAWKKRRRHSAAHYIPLPYLNNDSSDTIIPLDASKSSSGDGDHKDALRLYERTFETSLDRDFERDRLDETQSLQDVSHGFAGTDETQSLQDVSHGFAGTDETNPGVLAARAQTYRALTCNDCNRKFCLDYKLPICKDAKEEDRDSRKDQAVVFIFIFATGGLLLWALLKPWIERFIEAARERRSYVPVGESEGS